jgi:HTH-type transcriptional regulator / antitoxin HigA
LFRLRSRHPIPEVSGPDALRSMIEFRGVTQSEVARETGIAETVISEIVRGKRSMGVKTIDALASYFRIDPGIFLRKAEKVRP